ncbi:DUF2190 family protein [Chitinophaga sp. CF418]|uniref:DUF2190 family protein n=1 Tax=Chitinophaga sp. CF418 TaxID=1855287 RepID=UPI00091534B0|nr:DUF2190 family protein [Chitinophaga sp. CF418]SHN42251.1 Predicted phage recombinase, RecA/RadA family [Chitinophaga sp. CF418]
MSTNFRHSSRSIQIVATANVTGGSLQIIGGLVGVAESSVLATELYTLALEGAFTGLPKKTGEAWAVGDMVYFDDATDSLTKTASTNVWVGYAAEAAALADSVGCVLLKQ